MKHRTEPPARERLRHPGEGELRAYLDGELSSIAAARLALHLRRCTPCAHLLDELRAIDARATSLLGTVLPRRRRPTLGYGWRVAIPITTTIAAGLMATFLLTATPTTHARAAGGYTVQDVCCFNLDGGERADDGMLTVSRVGQIVDCVLLYEDRAGLRRFAEQDPLRFVSTPNSADHCEPGLLATIALASTPSAEGL